MRHQVHQQLGHQVGPRVGLQVVGQRGQRGQLLPRLRRGQHRGYLLRQQAPPAQGSPAQAPPAQPPPAQRPPAQPPPAQPPPAQPPPAQVGHHQGFLHD